MAVQRSMKAAISILDKSSTNTGNCKRQLSAVKQAACMHMQVPVNSKYSDQGLVLGCLATDSVSAE